MANSTLPLPDTPRSQTEVRSASPIWSCDTSRMSCASEVNRFFLAKACLSQRLHVEAFLARIRFVPSSGRGAASDLSLWTLVISVLHTPPRAIEVTCETNEGGAR